MNHFCQFITGAKGTTKGTHVDYCGALASIKHGGTWYCAEHFDLIESDDNKPFADFVSKRWKVTYDE